MEKNIRKYLFTAIIMWLGMLVSAEALPSRPSPPRLVNDYIQLLRPAELAALESKLLEYERQHSTQIAIVITNDLHGHDIADFSTRLGQKWGVGKAGFENGVVITMHLDGRERRVYIAVGYGLEAVIPDITAHRIVENEMIPHFRNENYYQGLDQGAGVIMQLAAGEFTAQDYQGEEEVPLGAVIIPFIFVILVIVLMARSRRRFNSPGKGIPFWTLFWLMSHGNRGSRGSFGNFSSGRGSFGGGRGGSSFGGFGGGRFGGGGAGGSW